jgi:hypothetical protein
VTVSNFINVLTGKFTGQGPVLATNSRSRVFINLVDHGGAGLFAFPSEYLYADRLQEALSFMSDHNMYRELVLYLESCESGSMFQGMLPSNTSVYAVSASTPDESSWGCYCPGDDKGLADYVNGTELETCLGDLFSVSWMDLVQFNCTSPPHLPGDSSATDSLCKQTLLNNFRNTSILTNLSTPMQWGDQSFTLAPVGGWVSDGAWPFSPSRGRTPQPPPAGAPLNPISSRDASRRSLERRVHKAGLSQKGSAHWQALTAELAELSSREAVQLKALAASSLGLAHHSCPGLALWDCYRHLVDAFENKYGRLTDSALGHTKKLFARAQALTSRD